MQRDGKPQALGLCRLTFLNFVANSEPHGETKIMNRAKTKKQDCSIIALDKFIQATRDSGYKGTSSAVSELVDNAIQAEARNISISIEAVGNEASEPPRVFRRLF